MNFTTKIFADGAEIKGMFEMYKNPMIAGFTTNPTLMRKAGITDYPAFAKEVLQVIKDRPISFEVFSDDFDEMFVQAKEIAKWGSNVNVKIPITNTKGESSFNLVKKLQEIGVKVNVTAIMTVEQVKHILPAMKENVGGFVSVFAGRIADAGIDPLPIMTEVMGLLKSFKNVELIWASPRELFNLVQANNIGCHIITVTNDILKKMSTIGKDLTEFSLDTVKMFYNDAHASGFKI